MDQKILEQRAQAFNHLFDAVVVTDTEGIIIDWNIGAEKLYGYTKKEVLGEPVSIIHVPEDVEHIASLVISSVKKFGKWNGEVRMLHKDGNIGWIESMCVPILDDNNQMIGALGINRDITARKEESERLQNRAHYDELTQLPNRYWLLDRLTHLIEHSKHNKSTFALFFIDLDKFKTINDTKGHTFGDKVLKEVSSRLSHSIRNTDTIARIGGDEFILLFENTSDPEEISKMAEMLIKVISEDLNIDDNKVQISCSIGIATYPKSGTTTDALLLNADDHMYKAKSNKRGTYQF